MLLLHLNRYVDRHGRYCLSDVVCLLILDRLGITGAMSYSMNGSSNILDFLRTDGIVE